MNDHTTADSAPTTRHRRGTGIALALAGGALFAMGGTVAAFATGDQVEPTTGYAVVENSSATSDPGTAGSQTEDECEQWRDQQGRADAGTVETGTPETDPTTTPDEGDQ